MVQELAEQMQAQNECLAKEKAIVQSIIQFLIFTNKIHDFDTIFCILFLATLIVSIILLNLKK